MFSRHKMLFFNLERVLSDLLQFPSTSQFNHRWKFPHNYLLELFQQGQLKCGLELILSIKFLNIKKNFPTSKGSFICWKAKIS